MNVSTHGQTYWLVSPWQHVVPSPHISLNQKSVSVSQHLEQRNSKTVDVCPRSQTRFRDFSGMSVFAWLSWHVHRDHATFLSGQITVCLGLEYLCVAAGGLCSVSGRDQRGPTWKYFCGVKGQCYWTWVTTSIGKRKTLSVMREMLGLQEQRKVWAFFATLLFFQDTLDKNKNTKLWLF